MKVLAGNGRARDNERDRTVAFQDVGGEPGSDEGTETGIAAGTVRVVPQEAGRGV